jgi:hypothetical protein
MSLALYVITYFSLQNINGWMGIFCKGALYSSLFIGTSFYSSLTLYTTPVLNILKKKLGN